MAKNMDKELYEAAEAGKLNAVKRLKRQGASLNAPVLCGMTAVHAAVRGGKMEVLEWMLEQQGVDIDRQDNHGGTPLHHAAYGGNVEVVQCLLRHGANRTISDTWGKTPLQTAKSRRSDELVSLLS